MPRPKVLPSQRQRAFEACGACRESKKRCSGTAPCTHCLRRGLGSSCLISNRPRAHRRTMSGSAAAARSHLPTTTSSQTSPSNTSPSRPPHPPPPPHAQTQVTVSSLGAPRRASSPANKDWSTSRRLSFRPISPSESREAEPATSTSRSADGSSFRPSDDTAGDSVVSPKPLSRMLLNLRGERGESSCNIRSIQPVLSIPSIHWQGRLSIIPSPRAKHRVRPNWTFAVLGQREDRYHARKGISSVQHECAQPQRHERRSSSHVRRLLLRRCTDTPSSLSAYAAAHITDPLSRLVASSMFSSQARLRGFSSLRRISPARVAPWWTWW